MKLRVDDHQAAESLVRFFRRRDYLAVHEPRGTVEVVPIRSVSERTDRIQTLRDLGEWRAENPGAAVRPSGEGADV
ncbi:MAG TPA: hypothetical protein VHF67_05645 [Gaiellaceae bacterium]|jgi:hypothetical protein|nr:hypothetical protein [Gaiellaceae bacterium]